MSTRECGSSTGGEPTRVNELVVAVAEGALSGRDARAAIFECEELDTMSSQAADELIAGIYSILAQKDAAASRLYVGLLERGNLLSMLEDAQRLSPVARRLKWTSEADERLRSQCLQLERAQADFRTSMVRTQNRKANSDAWNRMRSAPQCGTRSALLTATDTELLKQPPTFWYGLSLETLPEKQMRASMGRLDALSSEYGRGRFPCAVWRQYDEQMARMPMPAAERARWRRWLAAFVLRVRKRRKG